MALPDGLLEVGRIDKVHGLQGEVVVTLTSDRTERLAPGSRLWVGDAEREVLTSRPHQQRWLVRFAGAERREDVEALRGAVLRAAPLDADDGSLWVHELIGATVTLPDGTEVGTVTAVQENPAHDLLVLDGGDLVPVVFVTDGSDLPGRVVIDPPEGLLS